MKESFYPVTLPLAGETGYPSEKSVSISSRTTVVA
jgi:hypothetical protein